MIGFFKNKFFTVQELAIYYSATFTDISHNNSKHFGDSEVKKLVGNYLAVKLMVVVVVELSVFLLLSNKQTHTQSQQ